MSNVIRLDLNDRNESTIYLSEDCVLPIAIDLEERVEHFGITEMDCKKLFLICIDGNHGAQYTLKYEDVDQRNIDLRYILNQIDELLGVEREKEEF